MSAGEVYSIQAVFFPHIRPAGIKPVPPGIHGGRTHLTGPPQPHEGADVDAIQLLIQDHGDAKKALQAVEDARGGAKKELFAALARDLKVHNRVEENLFYPAVRGFVETAGYAPADREAHQSVEKALLRLKALPVDDPHWATVFDLMRTQLLRHIADEETHLFPKVRSYLDDAKLQELGKRMKLEKDRLMAPV